MWAGESLGRGGNLAEMHYHRVCPLKLLFPPVESLFLTLQISRPHLEIGNPTSPSCGHSNYIVQNEPAVLVPDALYKPVEASITREILESLV